MKKRQDCRNISILSCWVQYKTVSLLKKNGNIAEIFQYRHYAYTMNCDAEDAKWMSG